MAGLIITLSEFVQCFSGLRAFSLNHSSFDFPSSLFGRQGRWYDPVSQMRKSRPMGSNKMYPAKWLRWMGPRPWSHHLELSPAQPAPLATVPRPVLQGAMLSGSPEVHRRALHVLRGYSRLLFLSFPCFLLFFQARGES